MSAGPTVFDPGLHVYVRPDVLYFDEHRVHLADDHEYQIDAKDAGLLELVYRGDSDFGRLCAAVAGLGGGPGARAVAASLTPTLADSRSILELRPAVAMPPPEIIVCDFAAGGQLTGPRGLVRALRRTHRVLHLGLDESVQGPWPLNASLVAARRARVHQSWFEFAQWCRGVLLRYPDALVVLSGHQDTILFGDLAARTRSVVLLDPGWPARAGVQDVMGAGWLPEDPLDAIRDLHYALRFSDLDDIGGVNRGNGSSFATLEAFALRHAVAVGYAMSDQASALAALGRDAAADRLVHGSRLPRSRKPLAAGRRTLLLVASLEQGLDPLMPFLHLVRAITDRNLLERTLVLGPEGWFDLVFREESVTLQSLGAARPPASELLAALVFVGLVRDCRPAFECVAEGIPCAVVPSRRSHPLQDDLPDFAVLRDATTDGLAQWLHRVGSADDPLADELVAVQTSRARAVEAVRFVRETARVRAAATDPESAEVIDGPA